MAKRVENPLGAKSNFTPTKLPNPISRLFYPIFLDFQYCQFSLQIVSHGNHRRFSSTAERTVGFTSSFRPSSEYHAALHTPSVNVGPYLYLYITEAFQLE